MTMQQTATPAAPVTGVTTHASMKRQEAIAGLSFMTPAMIVLIVFLILPMFVAGYFSLTDWNGSRPLSQTDAYEMVGLENYQNLLIDGRRMEDFYGALRNTIYYVMGVVPIQTMLALVLAVVVNQRWLRGRGFFRTAYYFPSISSSIVVSFIFLFMFSKTGPVNGLLHSVVPGWEDMAFLQNNDGLLHQILGWDRIRDAPGWVRTDVLGLNIYDWLSGPSVAMFTIMLLAIWTTTGTMMVIYLAALQNIPGNVYEAAQVDGANAWQTFRYIIAPLLRPTTFFVVTLGLIGTFQVFDQVYVLQDTTTAETTTSSAYLVYYFAFERSPTEMGTASAAALILFAIIFVATILQRVLVGGDKAED